MSDSGKGWAWWGVGLAFLSLTLGLSLVWCNIERMDLAYDLKTKQMILDEKNALLAKLEVERGNLLSPYRLRQKAEEYGLGPADQGRIRRLSAKVE